MTWDWIALLSFLLILQAVVAFKAGHTYGLNHGHHRSYRAGFEAGTAWASRVARHFHDEGAEPTEVVRRVS